MPVFLLDLPGLGVHGSFGWFLEAANFTPECFMISRFSPHGATCFCQRFKAVHRWPAVCRFNLFTTKCERPLTLEESDFLLSPFRFQSGFSMIFSLILWNSKQKRLTDFFHEPADFEVFAWLDSKSWSLRLWMPFSSRGCQNYPQLRLIRLPKALWHLEARTPLKISSNQQWVHMSEGTMDMMIRIRRATRTILEYS